MDHRQAHNDYQRELFRHEVARFREPVPPEVVPRLRRVVELAKLEASDRVLDVGTGIGVLIPYIKGCGVSEIVGCDLSPTMLEEAERQHPDVSFWCGDVVDIPDSYGSFDAVFLNAMFGNVWDQSQTLRRVQDLLTATGRVCITHPLGSLFVAELHQQDPRRTPHLLPDRYRLRELTAGLDLKVLHFEDSIELYAAYLHRG